MKIKSLHIENFRCFDVYDIELAPRVTVLIGKNGAGKSTLLAALRKAMSFIFSKGQDVKFSLANGLPSLRVETYSKTRDLVVDEKGEAPEQILIEAQGDIHGCELPSWSLVSPTSSYVLRKSAYRDAFQDFCRIVKANGDRLPVLAYYSDCYPHREKHAKKTTASEMKLRNFGYYAWNAYDSCEKVWLDRYERVWAEWHNLRLEGMDESPSAKKLKNEFESVQNCIISLTDDDENLQIVRMRYNRIYQEICVETVGGETIRFRTLPAGYHRLLSIGLDLAYRSYLLNGDTQSSGIAIIDEVDLHLHPTFEMDILTRLANTFPNMQFVVSSHSPMVLCNLDAKDGSGNVVYAMTAGERRPAKLADAYGLDFNSTVRDFMETPDRNQNVKFLTDDLLMYHELGMKEEVESTLGTLRSLLGEDTPAMKRIETLLK